MKKAFGNFGAWLGRPRRARSEQRDAVRYRRYGDRLSEQPDDARFDQRRPFGRQDRQRHLGRQPFRPEGRRGPGRRHEGDLPVGIGLQQRNWRAAVPDRDVRPPGLGRRDEPRYGTFTAGRQYTSYYTLLSPYSPTTWLTGYYGAHPGDIDDLDTIYRANNSLVYTSPKFYGLTAERLVFAGRRAGQLQRRLDVERGAAVREWSGRHRGGLHAHQQLDAGRRRMGRGFDDVEQRRTRRACRRVTTAISARRHSSAWR